MESSVIKINTQTLENDSENVHQYLDDVKKQKETLETYLKELGAMWTGDAHDAFSTAMTQDLGLLQTVVDNVGKVYDYEVKAKNAYEKCEQQVGKLIDEIVIKEVE